MCFFNATWIKCAVIAICDLSGFPFSKGMKELLWELLSWLSCNLNTEKLYTP